MARVIFCQACERPGVEPTMLGYIADDGWIVEIAGYACRACHDIWEAPGAESVITGYVDLGGQRAMDWFVSRLRALGCDPQPR